MTKNELRKLIKSELSAVSTDEKVDASKKACGLLFEFIVKNDFDIVLSYIDLKNEISPLEMNRALMMQNKIVAVPKVVPRTQKMNFYILDNSIEVSEQLENCVLVGHSAYVFNNAFFPAFVVVHVEHFFCLVTHDFFFLRIVVCVFYKPV